jgi:integrase
LGVKNSYDKGYYTIKIGEEAVYSQNAKSRASKGSVGIKVSNGILQLRFRYGGKRHYLSLGLSADDKRNWKAAERKAAIIEDDILKERLDMTLAKYKPQSALATFTPVFTPITSPKPDLAELWKQYEAFKKPLVSQTTYAVDYRKYRNHIAKLPTQNIEEAIAIRDYLVANLTPNTTKRVLTNLCACCDWAVESGLITSNPFQGMAAKIQLPKAERGEEYDIDCFSRAERDIIIEAFEESKHYRYYAPLVKTLFFTGMRPSEAIALQWKHIGDKFIAIAQSITISENGHKLKDGLKTQEQRRFSINDQLRNILNSIRPENAKDSDFIFLSKTGKFIDFGDFLNHAWRGYKNRHGRFIEGIVTRLVREGKVERYRRPYQCRHTFISLCLESGIDSKDISGWTGNSSETIYRYYASNQRNLQVPEL